MIMTADMVDDGTTHLHGAMRTNPQDLPISMISIPWSTVAREPLYSWRILGTKRHPPLISTYPVQQLIYISPVPISPRFGPGRGLVVQGEKH